MRGWANIDEVIGQPGHLAKRKVTALLVKKRNQGQGNYEIASMQDIMDAYNAR